MRRPYGFPAKGTRRSASLHCRRARGWNNRLGRVGLRRQGLGNVHRLAHPHAHRPHETGLQCRDQRRWIDRRIGQRRQNREGVEPCHRPVDPHGGRSLLRRVGGGDQPAGHNRHFGNREWNDENLGHRNRCDAGFHSGGRNQPQGRGLEPRRHAGRSELRVGELRSDHQSVGAWDRGAVTHASGRFGRGTHGPGVRNRADAGRKHHPFRELRQNREGVEPLGRCAAADVELARGSAHRISGRRVPEPGREYADIRERRQHDQDVEPCRRSAPADASRGV